MSIRGTDMTGHVSGKLTVLRFADRRRGLWHWLCRCECGNEKVISGGNLRRGEKSCGCSRWVSKHGHAGNITRSPEYRSWQSMKTRCLKPTHAAYKYYGGRGIRVCARWLESFENFLADMGPRPSGTGLERRDNNGNYEPTNCCWATHKQQMNNTRRSLMIEHDGREQTASAWAGEKGIRRGTFMTRLARGWSIDRALNTPVKARLNKLERRAA